MVGRPYDGASGGEGFAGAGAAQGLLGRLCHSFAEQMAVARQIGVAVRVRPRSRGVLCSAGVGPVE